MALASSCESVRIQIWSRLSEAVWRSASLIARASPMQGDDTSKFLAMSKARADLVSLVRYMPSSTRSNKETQLLFSPDPASLDCSIRKEAHSSSIDNNTCSSLDFVQPSSTQTLVPSTDTRSPPSTKDTHLLSTDIFHPTSIDTPSQTSIDTEPRYMVATLILVRDDKGDLHDQEGHLRNAAGES
ncbi:hypothetical protein F2Q68_00031778 [Brassica cretica]|uniref:Uncharacterized protein n=2 Tax=Brassica cretica TaxID=69181 RepID=A0A8S9G7X1_BRACR|nr:hypothetical protein F2Q68_00031778 [Brassica cretica]